MRTLVRRILAVVTRGRLERDLDDEVQAHLDLLARDYERRGMSAGQARLAAKRTFGGVEQMKESYRDRRGVPWAGSSRS